MTYSNVQIREKAILAYQKGEKLNDIANCFGIHRTTLYRWIQQYNTNQSLERARNPGSGRPSKLNDEEICQIIELFLKPATVYGFESDFWTLRRMIQVIKNNLKIKISKTTMYEIMYNNDFSYKKAEKRYYQADPEQQQNWLKKTVPRIRLTIKKYDAILYFEDEASISLESLDCKTWGPIGTTNIHQVTANRGSISAISAISNKNELIFNLYKHRIRSKEIIDFFTQMLKHHPKRHLVVVLDNAPPHTSKITRAFIESQKRLHVFYLPPRSPEFNPDEKVWNFLKHEELKNHQAKTKDDLKKITHKKLKSMSKKPALLKGIFQRCEIAKLFPL
jgi:transposase